MTIFYQEYRFRIIIVFCFITILMAIVWVKLIFLHVVKNDFYVEKVNSFIIDDQRLEGERGLIFDRNGNYLARNIKEYTFLVDTKKKYEKEETNV